MYFSEFFKLAMSFILAIVVTTISIYFFMSRKFNRCLYVYNRKETWKPPKDTYYEYNISIPGSIDQYINCWRSPNMDKSKDTLVFFHGTNQNKSLSMHIFELSKLLDMNFAMFDYRMYGKSSKTIRSNILMDADLFIDDLSHDVDPSRMILWAESLGGACAIHMANKKNFKYIILGATFSSVADIIRYRSRNFPAVHVLFRFFYNTFPSVDIVHNIKSPVIIIHSSVDDVVPYECSHIIYDKLLCPKKLITIGGTHVNPIFEQSKIKEMLDFMEIDYTSDTLLEVMSILEERNKVVNISKMIK